MSHTSTLGMHALCSLAKSLHSLLRFSSQRRQTPGVEQRSDSK